VKKLLKADTEEEKMSSQKKIDANRRNAQCSTGPRTPTGKRTSSRNSRKHGLLSRELRLADEDRPVFEKLHREVTQQLSPKTALQQVAVDQIIACLWRRNSALRLECQQLDMIIGSSAVVGNSLDESSINPQMLRWFGLGHRDLNAGIRLLAQLRDDICQNGMVRDCWKDQITACCGADFYKRLIEWAPMNPAALLLARHLVEHSNNFNMPLPPTLETNNAFVRDPEQERQMQLKLVDQYASFLDAVKKMAEEGILKARAGAANADFAPRYFTTTMRDLQRAVHWLLYLQTAGL
jgi:hypothetical protein